MVEKRKFVRRSFMELRRRKVTPTYCNPLPPIVSLPFFPPLSSPSEEIDMAKALQKAGFKLVGSTICYAFMQAVPFPSTPLFLPPFLGE